MTTATDVRAAMARTLRRDLIGPGLEDVDLAHEVLPARPSRWYLTGFLVPVQAPTDQRSSAAAAEGELNSGEGADGLDDADEPDPAPARPNFLPSSIGLSFLVPEGVTEVRVVACWGDYRAAYAETAEDTPLLVDPASEGSEDETGEVDVAIIAAEGPPSATTAAATPSKPVRRTVWHRTPKQSPIDLMLPEGGRDELPVPNSDGLALAVLLAVRRLPCPMARWRRAVCHCSW